MVPRIIGKASEKLGFGDKLALMLILFPKQREMMQIVPFGFQFYGDVCPGHFNISLIRLWLQWFLNFSFFPLVWVGSLSLLPCLTWKDGLAPGAWAEVLNFFPICSYLFMLLCLFSNGDRFLAYWLCVFTQWLEL